MSGRVEDMEKKLYTTPIFETKINRAAFMRQDLVVYPDRDKRLPDNLNNVIKFLFGKGAHIRQDVTNELPSLTIEDACYVLRNARTINADWTFKEVML